MFKYDSQTRDDLAFILNEREIATLARALKRLKETGKSTLPDSEIEDDLKFLGEISGIQQDSKFYAFFVENPGGEQAPYGLYELHLYHRQGDKVKDVLLCDDPYYEPTMIYALDYLKENKINEVYTGPFEEIDEFLGIEQTEMILKDKKGHSCYYKTHQQLRDEEIEEFNDNGIEVIILDYLI